MYSWLYYIFVYVYGCELATYCVCLMTMSFSCSAAANANYSLMSDSATGNSTTLAPLRLVCVVCGRHPAPSPFPSTVAAIGASICSSFFSIPCACSSGPNIRLGACSNNIRQQQQKQLQVHWVRCKQLLYVCMCEEKPQTTIQTHTHTCERQHSKRRRRQRHSWCIVGSADNSRIQIYVAHLKKIYLKGKYIEIVQNLSIFYYLFS